MVKQYFKEYYKLIILIPVLILVSYGYLVFSGNIRIDLEILIAYPRNNNDMGWANIGRFGLVFLQRLFGLDVYNRYYFAFFFFVFYSLFCEALLFFTYLCAKGSMRLNYWIFAGLFCTSNIYMFQFYFTVQEGEIAFVFFLLTVCAYFLVTFSLNENRLIAVCMPVLLIPFLVIGFGTYQAFVPFFISLCVVFMLLRIEFLEDELIIKKICVSIVIIIIYFSIALLIYQIIANKVKSDTYLLNQVAWESESFISCVGNIFVGVIKKAIGFKQSRFSFYPFALIMGGYLLCKKRGGLKSKPNKMNDEKCDLDTSNDNSDRGDSALDSFQFKIVKVIIIIIGMLSPFFMDAILGDEAEIRALFSLPLIASFFGMYFIYKLKEMGVKRTFVLKGLPIIIILVQIVICAQLSYTDYVREKEDRQKCRDLLTLFEANNMDWSIPTVYIGKSESRLNPFCTKIDVFGVSLWEHDFDPEDYSGVSKRVHGYLQATGLFNALVSPIPPDIQEYCHNIKDELSVFPNDGSVVEGNAFNVVKLSED